MVWGANLSVNGGFTEHLAKLCMALAVLGTNKEFQPMRV